MPALIANPLARARLESKTPVGSPLRTAQWAEVELGLRDQALFSAGVESVRTMAKIGEELRKTVALAPDAPDRAKFVARIREHLGAEPGDSLKLTDLASSKRLGLIYDHQLTDAHEYGRWKAGQDPAILRAFPCQELIREQQRQVPREWSARWVQAGGRLFAGRMIARKDDPIWSGISRFGSPWPPYDFGSGMGLRDVGRREAVALGVIEKDAQIAPQDKAYAAKLEASLKGVPPEHRALLQQAFGTAIHITGDKVQWVADALGDAYDNAIAPRRRLQKQTISFGTASQQAIRVARRDLGLDVSGYSMEITDDEVIHILRRHGFPGDVKGKRPSDGERRPNQDPLTREDLRALPHTWWTPRSMTWSAIHPNQLQQIPEGWGDASIEIQSDLNARSYSVAYLFNENKKTLRMISGWKKKLGG